MTQRSKTSSQSASSSFGLYIHWPFCASKCPYCDFNSHVNEHVDQNEWREALLQDLAYVGNQTKGRRLTSVFFGGGTPSLMPPKTTQALIDALSTYWELDAHLEISLEGNPNSIEVDKYRAFKSAGINRVSVGIQSLRQPSLSFLGRLHTSSESKRALEITRSLFDKSSFDLIYALPGQTLKEWEAELKDALELAQGHLSLYQLIIEPGTAFFTRHQRGEFSLPAEDVSADMFSLTTQIMQEHGYEHYEVSNFAKPSHRCRHNLTYWHYDDYVCVGPGAHGRVNLEGKKYAVRNHRAPDVYLEHVRKNGHGQKLSESITQSDQIIEHLMMNLRLNDGISIRDFHQKHGVDLVSLWPDSLLQSLKRESLISYSASTFRVTPEGMIKLDGILKILVKSLI